MGPHFFFGGGGPGQLTATRGGGILYKNNVHTPTGVCRWHGKGFEQLSYIESQICNVGILMGCKSPISAEFQRFRYYTDESQTRPLSSKNRIWSGIHSHGFYFKISSGTPLPKSRVSTTSPPGGSSTTIKRQGDSDHAGAPPPEYTTDYMQVQVQFIGFRSKHKGLQSICNNVTRINTKERK